MNIDIISAVPEILNSPLSLSIIKRGIDKGLVTIQVHDLHDYSMLKHRNVDDYCFGGGAGMVLMIEPVDRCITKLKAERKYDEVIFMTPDAKVLQQADCNTLSLNTNIIILCGHYKGIDQRIREHLITAEYSIGDYVLSGGELAAAVLCDSIIRLLPGVLNDETSALTDSFQDGMLSPPIYTRPAEYNGWAIPEILRSGNQKLIDEWRYNQALAITKTKRPDLLSS